MATVINNPAPSESSSGPMGIIAGLGVLLIVGYLFFIYAVPAIGRMQLGTTQINVPSKIDVNVTQTK